MAFTRSGTHEAEGWTPKAAEINHRPLAVQLIALYLWLKATALIVCVIAAHLRPSALATANAVIEGLVPMIMGLRKPVHDIWLAPIFVVVDATLGFGVWFLQKWARTVVVIDLTWLYGRALLSLPVILAFYGNKVHFRNPSVYFDMNILVGAFILFALCDPDVKRAFGMRF